MPFTDQLREALRLWDGAPGRVTIAARTYSGIGSEEIHLRPPVAEVPLRALELLGEDWTLNVAPETRTGGAEFASLPVLVVVWRPEAAFGPQGDRGYRHTVTAAGVERVSQALAAAPPVALLVDAGPEVWAAWRLERPIPGRTEAHAALVAIAKRLGGVEPAPLGSWTLPLAGPVRCWNGQNPDHIGILVVAPGAVYPLADLLKEKSNDADATPRSAGALRRAGRRGQALPA